MSHRRHHFAPLSASADQPASDLLQLKGIVFDMDGTLCLPQNYMFGDMREALGIDKATDILDHIQALPAPEQPAAHAKIRAIEEKAMVQQMPQPGLATLLEYLDRKDICKGICTRNFDIPVTHLLQHHIPPHVRPFAPVITRDFKPPKPSPAGILHIAHSWGIVDGAAVPESPASERPIPLIMVGDSVDDMASGRDAGALTVLLASEGKEDLETDSRTDVVIRRLDELVDLLEGGIRPRS